MKKTHFKYILAIFISFSFMVKAEYRKEEGQNLIDEIQNESEATKQETDTQEIDNKSPFELPVQEKNIDTPPEEKKSPGNGTKNGSETLDSPGGGGKNGSETLDSPGGGGKNGAETLDSPGGGGKGGGDPELMAGIFMGQPLDSKIFDEFYTKDQKEEIAKLYTDFITIYPDKYESRKNKTIKDAKKKFFERVENAIERLLENKDLSVGDRDKLKELQILIKVDKELAPLININYSEDIRLSPSDNRNHSASNRVNPLIDDIGSPAHACRTVGGMLNPPNLATPFFVFPLINKHIEFNPRRLFFINLLYKKKYNTEVIENLALHEYASLYGKEMTGVYTLTKMDVLPEKTVEEIKSEMNTFLSRDTSDIYTRSGFMSSARIIRKELSFIREYLKYNNEEESLENIISKYIEIHGEIKSFDKTAIKELNQAAIEQMNENMKKQNEYLGNKDNIRKGSLNDLEMSYYLLNLYGTEIVKEKKGE